MCSIEAFANLAKELVSYICLSLICTIAKDWTLDCKTVRSHQCFVHSHCHNAISVFVGMGAEDCCSACEVICSKPDCVGQRTEVLGSISGS